MKIYICIPSLNEAKTIKAVTELVDQGLQSLSSIYKRSIDAKIINIDSASDDKTVEIFRNVHTFFPKQSIILEKPRGKGKNILAFIEIVYREKATACLTIDADICSANPSWIGEFLGPILNNEADFVTPLYARSRFEGSSTNHFAYPIVLAVTGVYVRQPIAGDFAFNFPFLEIIRRMQIPELVNGYGIDIFLTLIALANGLRHKQVKLGEKKHNPSFDKLEHMFPQIAASALFLLREIKIKATKSPDSTIITNNILSSSSFPHKAAAKVMMENSLSRLNYADLSKWRWVPSDIVKKLRKFDDTGMQLEDWVITLSYWVKHGLKNKNISATILAEQLLPFFVLRATTFWFSSENMTAEEVENQIRDQSVALHYSFNKVLVGLI